MSEESELTRFESEYLRKRNHGVSREALIEYYEGKRPLMTHEERMRLINTPFTVRRIPPTCGHARGHGPYHSDQVEE